MPFIHDIGLEDEGIYQNWYPDNKSFVVRDNHCDCSYSISFSHSDVHTLAPSDQSSLFCLTIPLNMVCKAELLYYEGEPWKVRLTEVVEAEGVEQARAKPLGHHTGRSRMYFQEQSVQQDNSTRQESAH